MPLAGKPMIEWSLAALRGSESVAAIVIAAPPGYEHGLEGEDITVVAGGATRAQSVTNAMGAVETELVAIHDAARPLLTPELVGALVAALDAAPDASAVIAATAITDTVKEALVSDSTTSGQSTANTAADRHLVVGQTLDRSRLWGAQTPQVFRAEALRAALAVDERVRGGATDEAMLVERAGGTVLIHPAPAENLKVTTPHDLRVAEMLLGERVSR